MIIIEIIGGPSDGLTLESPSIPPPFFSLPTDVNKVRAVYQSQCQCRCHSTVHEGLCYHFCGYQIVETELDEEITHSQATLPLNFPNTDANATTEFSGEKWTH